MARNGTIKLMLKNPQNKKIAFGNNLMQFSKWYGVYTFLYHKKSAITLIELMVTVSLVGTIFAAGITMLTTTLKFYGAEQDKNRASDDLVLALNWIKKDAMQADTITIGSDANGPILTLRITNYAQPVFTIRTETYSLSADAKTLIRTTQEPPGTTTGVRNITDRLDSSYLPEYSTPSSPNYLIVRMYTKDGDNTADQRMGVRLNCRERD